MTFLYGEFKKPSGTVKLSKSKSNTTETQHKLWKRKVLISRFPVKVMFLLSVDFVQLV